VAAVPLSSELESEPFLVQVAAGEDAVRITVHGPLDLSTVPDFQQMVAALEGTTGPVTLDLSGISFIDSTGLSALVTMGRELEVRMRQLVIVGVTDRVADLLRMTGVDGILGLR
jgi:anti-sigma B factor antagonist